MPRIFPACFIVAVAIAALAGPASASLITESYTLTASSGAGIGGISAGGAGTLDFTFNDSMLNHGSGLVSPLDGSLTAFTLTFGTAVLDGSTDVNAPFNPNVTVLNDVPDFATFTPPGYSFTASLNPTPMFTLISDTNEVILTNIAAVPEPAAFAVLGTGLLGLMLARRRHV